MNRPPDLAAELRLAARSAAALATTLALWGALDVETAARALVRARALPGPAPAPSEPAATPEPWRRILTEARTGRWARLLCRMLGVHVSGGGPFVEHGVRYPATGPGGVGRLFVMNHRSGLDILVCLAALEASLVSRADLGDWPVVGRGARRIGTLFVDRDDAHSGLAVLSDISQRLRSGRAVVIFPEGTAFDGDLVRPFKPGAFLAARRTKSEVVPLGIAYREREVVFGDEGFVSHMRRVVGLPAVHLALEAGEPLDVGTGRAAEVAERARARVQALVERARARVGLGAGPGPG
ncbi:MAG: 1-acyl-sn-glycerol-3-phosphate acyltransferase [Myxococcales bacterium]|nr:1-acyl-sn-glycerol-3-phosphate acyltransferase [Myxococcales bacterium]